MFWGPTKGDSILFRLTEEEDQRFLAVCNCYAKIDSSVCEKRLSSHAFGDSRFWKQSYSQTDGSSLVLNVSISCGITRDTRA